MTESATKYVNHRMDPISDWIKFGQQVPGWMHYRLDQKQLIRVGAELTATALLPRG